MKNEITNDPKKSLTLKLVSESKKAIKKIKKMPDEGYVLTLEGLYVNETDMLGGLLYATIFTDNQIAIAELLGISVPSYTNGEGNRTEMIPVKQAKAATLKFMKATNKKLLALIEEEKEDPIAEETKISKTICFNTGRAYTPEGQKITATLHPDGVVTFFDHSRKVDGMFKKADFSGEFGAALVRRAYDSGKCTHNIRSFEDGMSRGGCNSKYDDKA